MARLVPCDFCGGKTLWWGRWPGLIPGTHWELFLCDVDAVLTLRRDCSKPLRQVDQVEYHAVQYGGTGNEELLRLVEDLAAVASELSRWLPEPGRLPVVELGAGRGALTAALARDGHIVASSEPAVDLVESARAVLDLTVDEIQPFEAFEHLNHLPQDSVGSVVMWHVVEHLEDSWEVLRACTSRLVESGTLILQVPMAAPEWLYEAHRFVVLPGFAEALAARLDMFLAYVNVDIERLFMTVILSRSDIPTVDMRPPGLTRSSLPSDYAEWLVESRIVHERRTSRELPMGEFEEG